LSAHPAHLKTRYAKIPAYQPPLTGSEQVTTWLRLPCLWLYATYGIPGVSDNQAACCAELSMSDAWNLAGCPAPDNAL